VFSNFRRALDWFWYSEYSGAIIGLSWNYQGENLLSKVFVDSHVINNWDFETTMLVEQSNVQLSEEIEKRRDSVSFYRKYGGYFYMVPDVFFENEFGNLRREMNRAFKKNFEFKQEISNSDLVRKISDYKTLGIHLRNPIHYRLSKNHVYGGGIPFDTEQIFHDCIKYSKKVFDENKMEKVYVACENPLFIEMAQQEFGISNVIFNEHNRFQGNIDWFSKPNAYSKENMVEETFNCFKDAYNLSICNKLIGTCSNVFMGAVFMNSEPEIFIFPFFSEIHGC
jgi:hypothetical protein